MLPSWCAQEVQVIRPSERTSRGTTVKNWENATEHTLACCSVQPAGTSTDFALRDGQVTDRWRLYAQPGSDVRAGDRIVFEGQVFEVDGAPYEWTSPTGRVTNIQANLVEWRG